MVTFDLEEAGVVDLTKEGVNGSGGKEALLLRLLLETLSEQELSGAGTLKLEDRDCRPEPPCIRLIPVMKLHSVYYIIKVIGNFSEIL